MSTKRCYFVAVSATTDDYLKRMYAIVETSGQPVVSLGRIAERMAVTRGTVTSMMKTLSSSGYVDYVPRAGASLTPDGRSVALSVIRRHRLLELFLVQVVGLDWSEVHAEAELLEHAVSDRLLNRIDRLLGFPNTDPHGDPIPTPEGDVRSVAGRRLSELDALESGSIVRIGNETPAFLEYLSSHDLVPGVTIQVLARDEAAETVTVAVYEQHVTLGLSAAAHIEIASGHSGSSA